MNDKAVIFLIALLIDLICGDPPNRAHPVAWMGTFISRLYSTAPAQDSYRQLGYGGFIVGAGTAVVGGASWIMQGAVGRLPRPLNWLLGGLALKTTFSMQGLFRAAASIRDALESGDLSAARRLLGWHLVSRDTAALNESQVSAAAVESVAENTSDGVIAPLFYFVVADFPGAFVYRFTNTADAMLGYRDEQREWLGKIPARVDDLLNLVPARLTAGLFMVTARLVGLDGRRALRIWRRDGRQTDSPNAGRPMSAAAGALGVRLEKTGHYALGAGLREPLPADIGASLRLSAAATGLAAVLAVLFLQREKR